MLLQSLIHHVFSALLRFHHIPIIVTGSTHVSVVTSNYSILINLSITSITVIESSHVLHTEDRLIVHILSNSRRGRGPPFVRITGFKTCRWRSASRVSNNSSIFVAPASVPSPYLHLPSIVWSFLLLLHYVLCLDSIVIGRKCAA
jgi:hypothetical protein